MGGRKGSVIRFKKFFFVLLWRFLAVDRLREGDGFYEWLLCSTSNASKNNCAFLS